MSTNKTTTLADLVLSAQAAAQKAFKAEHLLDRQTVKLEEFTTSYFAKDDFPTWENAFNAQLEMLAQFSRQDSPATAAAKKQAAAS